jgi:hypothetical protein
LEEDWGTRRGSNAVGALCEGGTLGREFSFIKDDIAGKVNILRIWFETSVATLVGAIPEEDAGFTAKC